MRCILLIFMCLCGVVLRAQEIEPAIYKKDKKVKYSFKYTTYMELEGFSIPSMRVPEEKMREVKTPGFGFMVEIQGLLEAARRDYSMGEEIRGIERMRTCLEQLQSLDPYWELNFYKLELEHYAVYERKRYEREVVAVRRRDSLQRLRSKHVEDSLRRVFAMENQRADSLERARERYLYSKRDSIMAVERVRGYHFVNRESANLRTAPDPNAPLIVNMRVCTYLKVHSEPDELGYVYVEVSDYKGYVLRSHLVDNLDKITVPRADVKFAKANHYVSIYIPAGSTYDPLRPHLGGHIPHAKHPADTTKFVYKPYEPQYVKKTPEPIKETPKPEPIAVAEKPKKEPQPKKQSATSGHLHQCTATKADGTQCTNMTTTKNKKCYLHDE